MLACFQTRPKICIIDQIDGEEIAALMYSSGTTGRPKGTAVSHNAIIANIQMMAHPLFYGSGNSTGIKEENICMSIDSFSERGKSFIIRLIRESDDTTYACILDLKNNQTETF